MTSGFIVPLLTRATGFPQPPETQHFELRLDYGELLNALKDKTMISLSKDSSLKFVQTPSDRWRLKKKCIKGKAEQSSFSVLA